MVRSDVIFAVGANGYAYDQCAAGDAVDDYRAVAAKALFVTVRFVISALPAGLPIAGCQTICWRTSLCTAWQCDCFHTRTDVRIEEAYDGSWRGAVEGPVTLPMISMPAVIPAGCWPLRFPRRSGDCQLRFRPGAPPRYRCWFSSAWA